MLTKIFIDRYKGVVYGIKKKCYLCGKRTNMNFSFIGKDKRDLMFVCTKCAESPEEASMLLDETTKRDGSMLWNI